MKVTINLSILDFKVREDADLTQSELAINLSILDFKVASGIKFFSFEIL